MKMESTIQNIDIENIIPNRFQPRLNFSEESLNNLADSIREHGIVQPLVVRKVGDKFEIIAGERRYKAATIAGLTTVPVIIADLDDNESAEVAIVENTQRKNLSPIEEAKSYKKLLDKKYITQDQLAKRMGISQSNIANKIRLLNLDESVQTALVKEEITERHARSLLKVTDKMIQVDLLNKCIEEGWTVKKLDEEINNALGIYTTKDVTGTVNANSKIDINLDKLMSNSQDIEGINNPRYQYKGTHQNESENKKSLFFNNLESVSANMDPTSSFGFNPFATQNLKPEGLNTEVDYDLLDFDDEDDDYEDESTSNNIQQKVIIEKKTYETKEDVIEGIKEIIKDAKENDINISLEEFAFDNIYQFIVRIDKRND